MKNQPTPTSYAEALELSKRRARKLANNTFLQVCENGPQGPDGDPFYFAVRLHSTDVVTFHRDGRIVLNSGGWQTVTTKERMNRYLPAPYGVFQKKHVWYVWNRQTGTKTKYFDGITLKFEAHEDE